MHSLRRPVSFRSALRSAHRSSARSLLLPYKRPDLAGSLAHLLTFHHGVSACPDSRASIDRILLPEHPSVRLHHRWHEFRLRKRRLRSREWACGFLLKSARCVNRRIEGGASVLGRKLWWWCLGRRRMMGSLSLFADGERPIPWTDLGRAGAE